MCVCVYIYIYVCVCVYSLIYIHRYIRTFRVRPYAEPSSAGVVPRPCANPSSFMAASPSAPTRSVPFDL